MRSSLQVGIARRIVRSSRCVPRFLVEEVPCRDGQYSFVRTLDPGKDNDVPQSGIWTLKEVCPRGNNKVIIYFLIS